MEIARDRICALPAQAHAFAPVLARVYRNGFTEEAEEFARRCDFKLRHRDVIGGDAHSMTRGIGSQIVQEIAAARRDGDRIVMGFQLERRQTDGGSSQIGCIRSY